MKEQVDPKFYGLSPQTVLIKIGPKEFTLIMNRRSRIIMKDALLILKKVERIKAKVLDASVVLETNAPVCSKSVKFLEENGVKILNCDI